MSFQYVPGLHRIPKNPIMEPPTGMWKGVGNDSGYYAFEGPYAWGYHMIVREGDFCPHLLVDGRKYSPVYSDVNGYLYWSTGASHVYMSREWGWVHTTRFPGYEPVETSEYDREKGEHVYGGDSFYVLNGIPYAEGEESTMVARGRIYGQSAKKVEVGWDRWTSETEAGVYEAKGEASGTRKLGLPRFRGNNAETFLRSLEKKAGRFEYGRIHYSQGKWVIGEIGSAGGWHEGSEPNAGGGSVNFRFCKPEGSDIEGKDIAVSFDTYVIGDGTTVGYLGEAAVWR